MYDFYAAAVAVQWICVMDDSQGTAFLSSQGTAFLSGKTP